MEVDIGKMVEEIAMQAQENQEEFIFETIRPYCENILQMKINKQELKQILLNGIQKQQPKTGHWITDVYMYGRDRHTCSNCGKGQEYTTAFCSWCGADMRGEEE